MNIKKKISEIILLTLTVVVGGGYVYYSLLTDTGESFGKTSVAIYSNTPRVGAITHLGNINTKMRHKTATGIQNSITFGSSGTEFPALAGRPARGVHSSGIFSGGTGYSYSTKTHDKNPTSGGSGIGSMLALGSRGGKNAGSNEQSIQSNGGGITLSATGASTPFSVPLAGSGSTSALIDPSNEPLANELIAPVGEGWWLLLLMALGYVVWRKR